MSRRLKIAIPTVFAVAALAVPAIATGASTKTCEEEGRPHKNFTTEFSQKSACPSASKQGEEELKVSNQGGNEPPGQQP